MNDKNRKIVNQCINWLNDALYDIRCGKTSFGEDLIEDVIIALKDFDEENEKKC